MKLLARAKAIAEISLSCAPTAAEGRAAFAEKRAPVFRHR